MRKRLLTAVLIGGAGLAFSAMPVMAQEVYPGGESDESPLDESRVAPAAEVQGAVVVRGNALAVTGSDAVGLTILGVSLVGAGTVLVRRSRRRLAPAPA